MKTRRQFLKNTGTCIAASFLASGFRCGERRRPNILLIVSDDQGWNDVGLYASDIPTPHIDSIGRNGIQFTRFYVTAPVCTPSRFGLLTGRYQYRAPEPFWVPLMPGRHDDVRLPENETTLANELKDRGYATALIGKWHLGHGSPELGPNNHGFDYFYGFLPGCIDYYQHTYRTEPALYRNKELVQDEGWATDIFTDEALQFMDQHKDEPFFLFLSYNAPHYGKCPEGNLLQSPPEYTQLPDKTKDDREVYAAMVKDMDKNIGRVLQRLSELKLQADTIVIFLCDNGGSPDYGGSNKPLRGGKSSLWEGGIRVPCVMQWPRHIHSGQENEALLSGLDFYPTLLSFAGASTQKSIDGVDVADVILKNSPAPQRSLFFQYRQQKAVINGEWKYMQEQENQEYLFNLVKDPEEQENLVDEYKEKARTLREELNEFEKRMQEPENA